jgi:hypothetical protein
MTAQAAKPGKRLISRKGITNFSAHSMKEQDALLWYTMLIC